MSENQPPLPLRVSGEKAADNGKRGGSRSEILHITDHIRGRGRRSGSPDKQYRHFLCLVRILTRAGGRKNIGESPQFLK